MRARALLASAGIAALAAVATLAVAAGASGQELETPERTPGAVGEAEYDWALRDLNGERFLLERYRGQPLVLNVWATWCAPCVAELASLERLAGSLEGTGIQLLIVSPEPAERVRAFLRRHGYRLPAAVEDQRMPAAFELRALPTTYVLDASGRIVLRHRGAAEWDRPEVRRFLLRWAR